jgi:hypothetical protein
VLAPSICSAALVEGHVLSASSVTKEQGRAPAIYIDQQLHFKHEHTSCLRLPLRRPHPHSLAQSTPRGTSLLFVVLHPQQSVLTNQGLSEGNVNMHSSAMQRAGAEMRPGADSTRLNSSEQAADPPGTSGAGPPPSRLSDGRWKAYHTAADLAPLLRWLNKHGARESVLRTRVQATAAVMQCVARRVDVAGQNGGAPPAEGSGAPVVTQAQPPDAQRVGVLLLSLFHNLPEAAVLTVRGGETRRAAWRTFVVRALHLPLAAEKPETDPSELNLATGVAAAHIATAARPCDGMAALLLLEAMVATPWLRPFWRLWSLPRPHPEHARTWPAVWYRAKLFKAALREGRSAPARKELDLFERSATPRERPQRTRATRAAAGLDLGVISFADRSSRHARARVVDYRELGDESDASGGRALRRPTRGGSGVTGADAEGRAARAAQRAARCKDGGRATRAMVRGRATGSESESLSEDSSEEEEGRGDEAAAQKLHISLNTRSMRR